MKGVAFESQPEIYGFVKKLVIYFSFMVINFYSGFFTLFYLPYSQHNHGNI